MGKERVLDYLDLYSIQRYVKAKSQYEKKKKGKLNM